MKQPVRIVDLIGKVVARVSNKLTAELQLIEPMITGVHYLYGHYNDIRERLMKRDPTLRYPLIALFEDFVVDNSKLGLAGIGNMKLMILMTTRKDITREQREQRNYIPILEPIYQEFLKQLKVSGFFMIYGVVPHKRIDRPHWGDPILYSGQTGYVFNEPLDGIEISGLLLQTYLPICEMMSDSSSASVS